MIWRWLYLLKADLENFGFGIRKEMLIVVVEEMLEDGIGNAENTNGAM